MKNTYWWTLEWEFVIDASVDILQKSAWRFVHTHHIIIQNETWLNHNSTLWEEAPAPRKYFHKNCKVWNHDQQIITLIMQTLRYSNFVSQKILRAIKRLGRRRELEVHSVRRKSKLFIMEYYHLLWCQAREIGCHLNDRPNFEGCSLKNICGERPFSNGMRSDVCWKSWIKISILLFCEPDTA